MYKFISSRISLLLMAPVLMISGVSAFAHGEGNGDHEYAEIRTPFGDYEPGLEPQRTIEVRMNDAMRFEPSSIDVRQGEIIRFDVINDGELMHEFVLGTRESLAEHAELMKKFPGMEHDEPYMAHVAPGESRQIIWRFGDSGMVAFGCLVPGHFDAGMKGVVTVE